MLSHTTSGDSGRSSRHLGQRRHRTGSRGSSPGVQRNAEPRLQQDSHRRLRHIRRHRPGWLRLHRQASGTLTFNAGDTSQTVQVTVLTDQDDESDETLTLTLSNPSQATLDDATATGTIENGESSSGTQEDPPAETPVVLLTASFANMPATHNGGNFTFDLTFSENVKAGYARIRDDAFTISGARTIVSAVRKTQGSNQNWTITVKPDGNGAITITLPETTGCDATGAICTYDGRKLSGSTSAQVTGPV